MSNKKIKPSPKLTKYLNETLRLEKMKLKKLDRTNSVFDLLDNNTVRNNDEKKVRTLDNHIFKPMANLIYFFEFLNKHPELIDKFVDDIEDLFGLREHSEKDKNYETFARFIYAVLGYHGPEHDSDNRFNFERRCMRIMQDGVSQKISAFTNRLEKGTDFRKMITSQMMHARMYAEYFDNIKTGRENKKSRRLIGF